MTVQYQNIYQVLEKTVVRCAQQPAYFVEQDKQWLPVSWQDYKQMVDHFAMALCREGFQKGDAVAILAGNCLPWPVADLGTIAAGGIGVGLYPSSSAEQCAYILNHAEAQYVLVDSQQQLDKILSVRAQLNSLKRIIVTFATDISSSEIIDWQDFLALGKGYAEQFQHSYIELARSGDYEDIVIIVYTSGTTGQPKGACLSNRYVISSIQALDHFLQQVILALPESQQHELQHLPFTSLSFLPYCHVAERISGMYTRLYRGDAAFLVSDYSRLGEVLQIANPHGFGGLPRIYEKLYATIMQQVDSEKGFNKQAFFQAIEVNKQIKVLQHRNKPIPEQLQSQFQQAEENVYSKVRAFFGNRALYCSSGAAPLPEKVLEMFEYAGNIHILEAYGLTELVCCAFNTPQQHRANSVGKAMLGCQINIAEDGEILLKGPQLFSGYYKNEKATQEAIDSDGWLHTGDIGRLDKDGFLFITGRKKEFIKTSTGKKISPLVIENLCKRNHLISNVLVYGDNKSYLTALITLNTVELHAYAKQHQLHYSQIEELAKHPHIEKTIAEVIDEVNQRVSRTEQIKKYRILEQDFSIELNQITPTGKIKRQEVTQQYASVIESMYYS